jgi:chromosome segregation ATPase
MNSPLRPMAFSAFGLVLLLSGPSASFASSAACASAARDPQSIQSLQSSPDFPAVVASLAASCPEVLATLDLPLETILPTRSPRLSDKASDTPRAALPSLDEGIASRVAALRAATDALQAAAKDVSQAEVRVQEIMGRVDTLSKIDAAQARSSGLSLADLAQARRDAARDLRRARADLSRKSEAYDAAVKDADLAMDQAQRDLDDAKKTLSRGVNGADSAKLLAELKDKYDAVDKEVFALLQEQRDIKETGSKLEAEISQLKAEVEAYTAAIEAAKQQASDAKTAIEKAELAAKLDKGSEADLKEAKIAYEKAETEIKSLSGEVERLTQSLDLADHSYQLLAEEFYSLDKKLAEVRSVLPEVQKDYDALSALIDTVSAAEAALQSAAKDSKARITSAEEDRLIAETQSLQAEKAAVDLLSLTAEEQDLLDTAQSAGKALDQAAGKLDSRQADAQAELDKVTNSDPIALRQAADALSKGLDAAADTAQSARETQSELSDQVKDVSNAINDLQAEIDGPPAS